MITAARLSTIVVGVTFAAAVALFAIMLSSRNIDTVERHRVQSFIPMFLASAIFWSLFQQQFTVVALYAEQRLDLSIGGWTMPPSWVQSINPIFIIVFAGVFATMWTRLGPRQPATPVKFALGTIVMGVAFLLFLPYANAGPNSTPLLWIVLILFFFTIAELCLSPVGQSLSTKLAPKAFHTQMIALFFLSIAVGTAGAGSLAEFYDPTDEVPYFAFLGTRLDRGGCRSAAGPQGDLPPDGGRALMTSAEAYAERLLAASMSTYETFSTYVGLTLGWFAALAEWRSGDQRRARDADRHPGALLPGVLRVPGQPRHPDRRRRRRSTDSGVHPARRDRPRSCWTNRA